MYLNKKKFFFKEIRGINFSKIKTEVNFLYIGICKVEFFGYLIFYIIFLRFFLFFDM